MIDGLGANPGKHMSILLIAGSPSVPARSSRLLQYAGEQLALRGQRTTTLEVCALPAQALLHAEFANPELKAAQAKVAQADAVNIATPVYKAAYILSAGRSTRV